jgi:transcriptional regulator with XRE-family HTH domain
MYDRFKELCEKHGKSMKEVCDVIGIKPSAVSNWKKRGSLPNGDTCLKISKYFGVSVDYLMTGKDWEWEAATPAEIEFFEKDAATPQPLTKREEELLEVFHKLSADQQEEVLRYGQFLYEKFHDERKKSSPSSKEA